MVKLYKGGAYLLHGTEVIADAPDALAAVKSKKILIMPSNINGWRKGVAGKKQSLP